MEEEKRNVLSFFAVSVLILVGYSYFFPTVPTRIANQQTANIASENTEINQKAQTRAVSKNSQTAIRSLAKVQNIKLDSKQLSGNISSRGIKITDIFLKDYHDEKGEKISVFGKIADNYYARTDWSSDDKNLLMPDENTCWEVSGSTKLTEQTPVTFSWDNKHGLLFRKTISVDENFVLTIENRVKNYSGYPMTLRVNSVVNREFSKKSDEPWTFYNGPLGYTKDGLKEVSYKDIVEKNEIVHQAQGGWFGITDKYWLVAFIPDRKSDCKISYKHAVHGNKNIYRIESDENAVVIAPSREIKNVCRLFVGAKEIKTLDMYETKLGVKHFDLAIDFGKLYIFTKPLLYALAYMKDLVGNMGLAILLLTLLVKLLLLPLANKSYRSMNRMKEVQPKMQAIQKKYANDKVRLGQEISALYKKEGVNPVGGCLPVLLQSPVLFALYKVLYISIEMRQAPFIWWIHDLSLPDSMYILNLFGLIPIELPGFLQVGILPILMGLAMFLQQKMGPTPTDPAQANMMFIMPIMFTFMFAGLPSGLVLYMTFSYILAIGQQSLIIKMDEAGKAKEKAEKTGKK